MLGANQTSSEGRGVGEGVGVGGGASVGVGVGVAALTGSGVSVGGGVAGSAISVAEEVGVEIGTLHPASTSASRIRTALIMGDERRES